MNFDYFLFQKINNLANQSVLMDKIGIFFAQYLIYFLVLLTLGFVIYSLRRNKNWKLLWQSLLTVVLSRLVITELIRFFWHRPRPFLVESVHQLTAHTPSGSFPSGHLAFLFALAAVIYFNSKSVPSGRQVGWLLFAGGFLVGLGRIFVGVHYPLDILAGIFIGFLSAWLVKKFIIK